MNEFRKNYSSILNINVKNRNNEREILDTGNGNHIKVNRNKVTESSQQNKEVENEMMEF